MTTAPSWLLEKHISERALPNEEILSWLKWDESFDFDQLVIKLEADIKFLHVLNVDEKVFKQKEITHGKAIIDKDMLQLPGFVGFTCFYELVPDNERELNFEIDFLKSNKLLETIQLKTKLIRPIAALVEIPDQGIVVTETKRKISPLKFKITNNSTARILNLSPFIEFVSGKSMRITIKETLEKIEDTEPLFVYESKLLISKFFVTGQGYGMITMGFEYQDAIGLINLVFSCMVSSNLFDFRKSISKFNSLSLSGTNS